MPRWSDLLSWLKVREGEGAVVARAAAIHFLLLTANYLLRPVRDAFAIAGGADRLPWLFTATFLGVLVLQPLYAVAVGRFGRPRLVPLVYRVCAAVLLVFYGLLQTPWRVAAANGFFVWMSVFNLFALSLLWSVMSDRHQEKDARRLFGLVAFGGSAGAIVGPVVAGVVARYLTPGLLLVLAAVLLEAGIRVGRPLWAQADEDRPTVPKNPLSGLVQVMRSPKLRVLAGYLVLMTWASTVAYFIQGHIVERVFETDASRTQALAAIDLAVNVLTMVGQGLVTGRILSRFGLGVGLWALPVLCVAAFGVLAAIPTLAGLAGLQLVRRTANYVLAKPAREAVYTRVEPAERYQAKSFVDTVVYRGGDAVAGWGFAGLQALGLTLGPIAAVAAGVSAGWALLARHLSTLHGRD